MKKDFAVPVKHVKRKISSTKIKRGKTASPTSAETVSPSNINFGKFGDWWLRAFK